MSGISSLSSAIDIDFDEHFWTNLQAGSGGKRVGFFKNTLSSGGLLYLVAMHSSAKMIPFVRSAEELFADTAKRESVANKLRVVINGPTYGLTRAGKADALFGSDPVAAEETLQEGRIVYNKKVLGGRRSDMYYIANNPGAAIKYKFGRGAAPTTAQAALGNMGPLIINGLPFGNSNRYDPPQPKAVAAGEPKPEYRKHLVQRSNNRYKSMAAQPNPVGKIAIGFRRDKARLIIFIQPHATPGISIEGLRDIALFLGLDSAVYLDGSDSVMLMMDNNMLIKQASNKNETNVTGVGFRY